MKILNILYHRQNSQFHQVHISFENVLLLAKLNRWDWRRCLLINVKPSNVLRPPVKEMMFDVVWSLQRRVAPQLSSSTFVSLSLLSCTKTSFSTNRTIKFDIALPVWSHPAITFQKRNYSFSTAAVNLLLLLSFLESNLPRNHHSWVWQLELDTPIDILRWAAADPNYPPFGQQEDSLVSSRCPRKTWIFTEYHISANWFPKKKSLNFVKFF